jgi:hypothetical protein
LNDVGAFEKANVSYHLDITSAFDNSLMCELAGDFLCSMRVGVGMHMTLKNLSDPQRNADGDITSMDADARTGPRRRPARDVRSEDHSQSELDLPRWRLGGRDASGVRVVGTVRIEDRP